MSSISLRIAACLAAFFCIALPAAHAAEANSERFDGPAELPRIYLQTSMADTPAPGKVHNIKSGGDLQSALNNASCGDTLSLEAGATFTGRFVFPKKNCDDSHWIIVRTSAPDSELPPQGSRLTPCYAGVSSLPGRPDLHCTSTTNVLAKLVFAAKAGEGPVIFAPNANHYRLTGLEITRAPGPYRITALIAPEVRSGADHIVLDRLWAHGTAQDETTRGVFLTGTAFISIVDSTFTDFHCVAITGACGDSQAIGGGSGDLPGGPYKIVDNFLEASGENILFGGGPATITPADIEIRRNHFFKPLFWKPGQPDFVGGTSGKPFIVKNLFELKNAQRVLFEGNVLDYSWGGVGQKGFAIMITPKNAQSQCPTCRVTDLTMRYNKVRHMASAMDIANVPADTGGIATAGERYSIHDMIFEDIDGTAYVGFGAFAIILSNSPPLRDVTIDHVTAFPPTVLMSITAFLDQPLPERFVITNSILSAAEREVASAGGGPRNCATGVVQLGPEAVLRKCFKTFNFSHNAILAPRKPWPKDNWFPKNEDSLGFVEFNRGKESNYRLCRDNAQTSTCKKSSPYAHAATDGKDVGADVDAIEAATRNVE